MDIFQEATLLNNIITDLRPIIQEYLRTYPLFVIGKHNSSYPGYRMTTKNDIKCDQTMKTFGKYYTVHKGLPAIDSFHGDVLCCDKYSLQCEHRYIRCTFAEEYNIYGSVYIKLNNIIPFRISQPVSLMDNIHYVYTGSHFHYDTIDCKVGLYIKCD